MTQLRTRKAALLQLTFVAAVALTSMASCVAESGAPDEEEATGAVTSELTWDPKRHVTGRLGLPSRFLVGLGNDVTAAEGWDPNRAHAYQLSRKLDIHYLYLSGLDWPSWNSPEGAYITVHANAAKSRGVVPMFTLYQAAAWGENNLGAFGNYDFMRRYWRNVRTMYTRLAETGVPSMVHLEPDLWAYFQKRSEYPSSVYVRVGSLVPECTDLPENVAGFGKCLVRLAHLISPKALVGLSASSFAAYTNGVSDPGRIGRYLNQVGSVEADFLVVETLDRDAGCFESGSDPNCRRTGTFYWDETNTRSPSFHDHLSWARTIHDVTGKGLVWWQMPLGVPASWCGYGSHYRDNRVRYLFSHVQEFVSAGGVAAVFGTGAPNQTTAKTDGGQFGRAIERYFDAPTWF
jgi:hypothetical protein